MSLFGVMKEENSEGFAKVTVRSFKIIIIRRRNIFLREMVCAQRDMLLAVEDESQRQAGPTSSWPDLVIFLTST